MPEGTVELGVLDRELRAMLEAVRSGSLFESAPFDSTPDELRTLKDIAFSGNGEPTACRCFEEACEVVVEALRSYRTQAKLNGNGSSGHHDSAPVKVVLITNATLLTRPAVTSGLAVLDRCGGEVWAKLDAGTDAYYRMINRSAVPLPHVLENIAAAGRARPIVIQSMFCKVDGTGPSKGEVTAYVERLNRLRELGCVIKNVQVYTTARQTAEENVTPLSDIEIDGIVKSVKSAGLSATGYYGVGQR